MPSLAHRAALLVLVASPHLSRNRSRRRRQKRERNPAKSRAVVASPEGEPSLIAPWGKWRIVATVTPIICRVKMAVAMVNGSQI